MPVLTHNHRSRFARAGLGTVSHLRTTFNPQYLVTVLLGRESVVSRLSSGDATMWVALEVNVALWGMILCGLQTAQHFY
jgi:hypothetical protein